MHNIVACIYMHYAMVGSGHDHGSDDGVYRVLGKLGPGQSGIGQLNPGHSGPGQLGPGTQLSGAQFA